MSQMTPAEIELNDKQLSERRKFDNENRIERGDLEQKQLAELSRLGPSPELDQQHEKARVELEKRLAREGQQMIDRHIQEEKELRNLQSKIKPLKDHQREQEIAALNARYAEEREKTRQNAKEYRMQGESLADKLKRKWEQFRGKDRDV